MPSSEEVLKLIVEKSFELCMANRNIELELVDRLTENEDFILLLEAMHDKEKWFEICLQLSEFFPSSCRALFYELVLEFFLKITHRSMECFSKDRKNLESILAFVAFGWNKK